MQRRCNQQDDLRRSVRNYWYAHGAGNGSSTFELPDLRVSLYVVGTILVVNGDNFGARSQTLPTTEPLCNGNIERH